MKKNRLFDVCSIVDSTLAQPLIRRLYNRQFDCCSRRINVCATVELTLVRLSIRRLYNSQFDACTIVDSTLVQFSIRRLHIYQFNGCTTVDSMLDLIYMPFRTWINFIFSYFTSYLDGGSEFSSYEIELRNLVTQNDITLGVTNSKLFIEILLSSY